MDRRRLAGMHSRLQAGSAPLRGAYNHRLAGFLTGLSKLVSSEFHCLQIEPMRATVLSVLLVMVAASSAQAQTAPRIFYPAAAQTQGIGGEATVECLVGDNGRLACETIEEAPANMGFGAAALFYALAPLLRYAAMFPAWMAFWVAFAVLRWRFMGEPTAQASRARARGVAAALISGLAFYAISGIWTRPSPEGPDYLLHFASWSFAFAPGFMALLLENGAHSAGSHRLR